ncbi:MAG: SMP-30/gluconolactonase/LRE family protein [bacterium]|nr:SMP-30/gluconolactonase/LRE family protein [bacterium]
MDQFQASEGLTFNAEGRLFIGANKAVWRIEPDGAATRLTEVYLHLGQAGIGERDILAADFGPTNVFNDGPNDDGIVWRITPEGEKQAVVKGIADPNFILVRTDGSYLVSDDGTDKIYLVTPEGEVSVWTDKIAYPNGMAFSLDGSVLYVAQIFKQLEPIIPDDRVWALQLKDGQPAGEPTVVGATGEGGLDGLALDEHGRIYIADNGAGKIFRLDPESGEMVLIAEGMTAVASLVFGEGDFDHHALYATSTFRGGGKIWKIDVGVKGAPLNR